MPRDRRKNPPAKASTILGLRLRVDPDAYDSERGRTPVVALTPDVIDEAARIVGRGNYRTVARQMIGIPHGTWSLWIKAGKEEIAAFSRGERETVGYRAVLVQALEKAEAEVHQTIIRDVITGDNMQAKLWYLERRYNKLYTKNPNAHVDDESGEEVARDAAEILADRLRAFIEDPE